MSEAVYMACPRCGATVEDHDGFGLLACDSCGYCTHPDRYGGVCTICGDVFPVAPARPDGATT